MYVPNEVTVYSRRGRRIVLKTNLVAMASFERVDESSQVAYAMEIDGRIKKA